MEKLDVEDMANAMMGLIGFVTCSHCKSYLTSAVRCECGAACCAACWCGRCSQCHGTDRRALPDQITQTQVSTVQHLVRNFELCSHYNMDAKVNVVRAKAANNVMDWLTRSKNQFQLSLDGTQAGWDDVHVLPDSEDQNVEPAETEAVVVDDEDAPRVRRSSRKRGSNADYPPPKKPNVREKEAAGKPTDTSCKWKNVKKMRKEFSKLCKINKERLNVSINMCKKAKSNERKSPDARAADKENDRNVDNETDVITLPDSEAAGDRAPIPHRVQVHPQKNAPTGEKQQLRVPFLLKGKTHREVTRKKTVSAHIPFMLKGKLQPAERTERKLVVEVEARDGELIDDVRVRRGARDLYITIGERHRKIVIDISGAPGGRSDSFTQTCRPENKNTSSADTKTAEPIAKRKGSRESGEGEGRSVTSAQFAQEDKPTPSMMVLDSSFEEPPRKEDRPEILSEALFTAEPEPAGTNVSEDLQRAQTPPADDDSVVEGTPQHNMRSMYSSVRKSASFSDTPLTQTFHSIKHHSTPTAPPARKALSFYNDTLNNSHATLTTQERAFLKEAFDEGAAGGAAVSGSCLSAAETGALRAECARRGWSFSAHFSEDLTHLVVSVDEDNRAQRSVKFMLAVACGKWVVSTRWLDALRGLPPTRTPNESAFEVLDMTGCAGPRTSRLAPRALLSGVTVFCGWTLQDIDVDTLRTLVTGAGGALVTEPQRLLGAAMPVVLAEDGMHNNTSVMMVAMKYAAAPVGLSWLLDSVGQGRRLSVRPALLCAEPAVPAHLLDALEADPGS